MSEPDGGDAAPGVAALVANALRGIAGTLEASTRPPIGVGIDVEDAARWRGDGIRLDALFTVDELAYCHTKADPALHLAGFWCMKEAVFKAVSGRLAISLRDVCVSHRSDGAPRIELRGQDAGTNDRILVSVSHSPTVAVAIALFFGK